MLARSHQGRSRYDVANVDSVSYSFPFSHLALMAHRFGIMLGNIMGVAFGGLAPDLGWYVFLGRALHFALTLSRRLMLGSTVVLPLIVCAQVYFCPESPRWLVQHNKVDKAFRSFRSM